MSATSLLEGNQAHQGDARKAGSTTPNPPKLLLPVQQPRAAEPSDAASNHSDSFARSHSCGLDDVLRIAALQPHTTQQQLS
jgi:hypothetical protein